MFDNYDVTKWFWIVGDDTSRAWSSAEGRYVTDYPQDRVTRITSEVALSDVLRPHGLTVPAPNAADVKSEAQRRIIELTGASTLETCLVKQLNALMRATELTNKVATGATLSPSEAAEATQLKALADAIRGVRAASDAIEAMQPIPADFNDDARWPA